MLAAARGRDPLRRPADRPAPRRRDIVAAGLIQVPEGRKIFPNMSVRENLELGSYRRGERDRAPPIWSGSSTTFPRLQERVGQAAGTLSGGEQQMLAIGRGHDGGAAPAHPRRALARPVAAAGRGDVRADPPPQRRRACRSCWSSRTSCSRSRSPIRAYILENGGFALSGTAARAARRPELKRAYLGL